jgi:Zn-dependent alcohol dehydrogenase
MMVGNKVVVGGNFPGINVVRDLPKFIRLIERGQFDAKSMIGKVFKPDQIRESVVAAGERTVITAVVDFT